MWTGLAVPVLVEALGVGHDRLSAGGVLAGEDVRGYVIEHLGDPGAVLVVDLCRSWNYAEAPAA
ncbi:MAG TPA: hypothetical protein VJ347_08770 [Streptosporangiaceae bacterium]|nr:hypothetical protein [Streptosporangiaceae bacterium]